MEGSPFNRSARTARTPPPTPPICAAHGPTPAPTPDPRSRPPIQEDDLEVVATSEIQKWMITIEQCLSEVCHISAEGKLNTDQKLRISNLCRKVSHGTSQMAVQYQAIKAKTIQAHSTIQTLEDQHDLAKQLHALKKNIDESSKPVLGNSFADMVKKGTDNYIRPLNISSVAIYPHNKLQSSEDTKSLVQKIIRPEQMKLHVRGLRKTRNGGVIISTESKDDIEKLKSLDQIKNSGLTLDEPFKRKPRVVIVGVPSSMPEKEVFTCLYNQNIADVLQDFTQDKFLGEIKLSHKSGKKDAETCNYIIEVPGIVRKALITKERVFVNWSSCPVRDFTLVTRCYKCQQYGHAAKSCRDSTYTCGHCGAQGHTIKECTNTKETAKCATCLHFKKPSNHNTGAADCPAKLMAEKRYINTIDFGGA